MLAPWPLLPVPSAQVCAHHKDCSILSGAHGEGGRDTWQGRVSTWPVWQKNEKNGRPPGSVFIQGLAEVLQMLSGSVDADAISPSAWSNISGQPQSPEAYSLWPMHAKGSKCRSLGCSIPTFSAEAFCHCCFGVMSVWRGMGENCRND